MRKYYLERQIKANKDNRDRLLTIERLSDRQHKELELVKAILKLQEMKLKTLNK